MKVGERVGAVLSANEHEVQFLGYGTYEGDLEPPFGPFGFTKEEYIAKAKELTGVEPEPWTNPCIKLDNGDVVWGCQCWWGDVDKVYKFFGKRKVILVRK